MPGEIEMNGPDDEQAESEEMHRQNDPHYFKDNDDPEFDDDHDPILSDDDDYEDYFQDCPHCEGDGCEECDWTGEYR
jgi:hypothetical protein